MSAKTEFVTYPFLHPTNAPSVRVCVKQLTVLVDLVTSCGVAQPYPVFALHVPVVLVPAVALDVGAETVAFHARPESPFDARDEGPIASRVSVVGNE